MHIYAFGSICRGDINPNSDIDLLAIVNYYDKRLDPQIFSIYSYKRIKEIWLEGNPFAWHLHKESQYIFSESRNDFLKELGSPQTYRDYLSDCEKFYDIFVQSKKLLSDQSTNKVFELSNIFLGMRNIATCYSLGCTFRPNFSRHSSLDIGEDSLKIPIEVYSCLENARILSTRGQGLQPHSHLVKQAIESLDLIDIWMVNLVEKARRYDKIYKQNCSSKTSSINN